MLIREDWEKAYVTSVFKNGKKEDPRNYTLVSLTLVPRKGMEQLILKAKHIKGQESDWE